MKAEHTRVEELRTPRDLGSDGAGKVLQFAGVVTQDTQQQLSESREEVIARWYEGMDQS